MTVQQLQAFLATQKPDALVKTTHGEEGNYYAPIVGAKLEPFGAVVLLYGDAEVPGKPKPKPKRYIVGERAYWTDPDNDFASGNGTIAALGYGDDGEVFGDEIISLKMDDKGEVEALAHELGPARRE